jgi:hypothetical protein
VFVPANLAPEYKAAGAEFRKAPNLSGDVTVADSAPGGEAAPTVKLCHDKLYSAISVFKGATGIPVGM